MVWFYYQIYRTPDYAHYSHTDQCSHSIHCTAWLAASSGRYSPIIWVWILPPASVTSCNSQLTCLQTLSQLTDFWSYVMTDDLLDSLSWCQAPMWGPWPDFLLLSDICRFVNVGMLAPSLMRGRASPAQSFSGPSPAGLTTTFYYLKFYAAI
jgi:hypothetical protein